MSVPAPDQASGTVGTSTSPASLTWSTKPAPGSSVFLVVAVGFPSTTISDAIGSVTDNGSPSRTFVKDASLGDASLVWLYLLRADNVQPGAGTYTVTLPFNSPSNSLTAVGESYSGMNGGGSDVTVVTHTGGSSSCAAGPITAGQAGDLYVAVYLNETGSTGSSTVNAPFTVRNQWTNGSTFTVCAIADATSSGAQTCTFTAPGSAGYATAIATYRPIPVPPPLRRRTFAARERGLWALSLPAGWKRQSAGLLIPQAA